MNFKQNSLFTRNTGYKEEPMESQGGVSVHPPIWKGKNPLGAFLPQPM